MFIDWNILENPSRLEARAVQELRSRHFLEFENWGCKIVTMQDADDPAWEKELEDLQAEALRRVLGIIKEWRGGK